MQKILFLIACSILSSVLFIVDAQAFSLFQKKETHIQQNTVQQDLSEVKLDVNEDDKKLTFNLNELLKDGESVRSVIIKNNNTLKNVFAGDIHIYDKDAPKGLKYKNELSE